MKYKQFAKFLEEIDNVPQDGNSKQYYLEVFDIFTQYFSCRIFSEHKKFEQLRKTPSLIEMGFKYFISKVEDYVDKHQDEDMNEVKAILVSLYLWDSFWFETLSESIYGFEAVATYGPCDEFDEVWSSLKKEDFCNPKKAKKIAKQIKYKSILKTLNLK